MTRLKLAFMGTPDFAVSSLRALADAGHEIAAVYSQPPRPAGRGHKERLSPVHAYAAAQGWQVRTPKSLKSEQEQADFAALNLDVAVVAAYGLILPRAILEAPRLGCLNVHASLLPRWRGAAPIQRAILAGDRESGVTIMQMDEGLDTGGMLCSERLPLTDQTTASDLHDRLAELGGKLIVGALRGVAAGELEATPQPDQGVTYAAKLEKSESQIDWHRPAVELARQVRAFTPWPGAVFPLGKDRIKLLEVEAVETSGPAGLVLDDALTVACGEGALRLLRLQRPGKGAMAAKDFLNGFALPAGTDLLQGKSP
ncbi:methionyl-tRNA formyltransferase [Denitrobaculum tricleocarpae]|uniref:Methionyl-tRNA formyltransferase n=1 Tax=Denitrobaculum tricleocarpae TaxID=2591009 RepID=A0A545U1A2_9PROT|nr:methionyl-tRNA formyltransferase [Denitrobaculum tricleocarpae]TQV83267.1 methionyl-tRNA formyltransferase [Denitrobaculum tricleocarpae]